MATADALEKQGKVLIAQYEALTEEQNKLNGNSQQLRAQMLENQTVEKELDLLDEDAEVFKALGPVLVKMELTDAKATVKQRLDRLQGEIMRLDGVFKEKEAAKQKLQGEIGQLQEQVSALSQKQQQDAAESAT